MEVKKSSKANLENKKGIFFEIGLIVALACIFLAFEWKVDVNNWMKRSYPSPNEYNTLFRHHLPHPG